MLPFEKKQPKNILKCPFNFFTFIVNSATSFNYGDYVFCCIYCVFFVCQGFESGSSDLCFVVMYVKCLEMLWFGAIWIQLNLFFQYCLMPHISVNVEYIVFCPPSIHSLFDSVRVLFFSRPSKNSRFPLCIWLNECEFRSHPADEIDAHQVRHGGKRRKDMGSDMSIFILMWVTG